VDTRQNEETRAFRPGFPIAFMMYLKADAFAGSGDVADAGAH
jgi:hypothetical protein